jgi:hypothetical protein
MGVRMGVEYGLYDYKNKEFVWLGKYIPSVSGFQLTYARMAAFLIDPRRELRIHADTGALPDDHDETWKRIATWHEESDDDE